MVIFYTINEKISKLTEIIYGLKHELSLMQVESLENYKERGYLWDY